MRLTGERSSPRLSIEQSRLSQSWAIAAAAVGLLLIFALDRITGAAPLQHLYYLPIIFAAIRFGRAGGIGAAILAIALYHFANPHVLTLDYEEADVFQIAVFIAVGAVAARLASDSRRLHRLAMTDDLTGLHNLRAFELRLRRMIRDTAKTATVLSMLVLDVDRLKALNDEHGHLAGAEAVRTVGEVLATNLPPASAACRYGGDEFVVALPAAGPQEALQVAAALRRAVHAVSPVLAGVEFPAGALSISVGVASHTFEAGAVQRESDVNAAGEALFRAADAALYAAKREGRNRVSVAAPPPRAG